jgi:hypothetical protein
MWDRRAYNTGFSIPQYLHINLLFFFWRGNKQVHGTKKARNRRTKREQKEKRERTWLVEGVKQFG